MFTTNGAFGDGEYFLRLSKTEDPNAHTLMGDSNGQPGQPQDRVIDGGFLELVRYGVRMGDDPHIFTTLDEYDDQTRDDLTRVRYDFGPADDTTPGWRRYGVDGYGEDVSNGANYGVGSRMSPGQRGRVWPIFTGEHGHYELAAAWARGDDLDVASERIRQTYVRGMERFANEGLLLPEQVWDGVGVTPPGYEMGRGTDSATPLAWSHAEYIKLLRSLADQTVWDQYDIVLEQHGIGHQH